MTTYILKKASGKAKPKEEKSTKMKELVFALMDENYLDFLCQLLVKHAQDKYKVTEMKQFGFKYVPPGVKTCETMDVDTADDYKEMVKKLREVNPASIKVSIDMKDVNKLSQRKGQENDTESASDDEELVNDSAADGVSALDRRLAKWWIDLEKMYRNESDDGFTYVSPTSVALPLMPLMILDWARAIHMTHHVT
ncbi:hypothetical protein HYDPIDRAFT_26992 [Hydnomerulius pinastri MD-312]|nr:hypothetical protein HYDPIDRAFT_26992 [Hydnomerulius pinastri MD-312]